MKKHPATHKKAWNTVSALFLALLVVPEVWAMYRLWDLAVLPGLYFGILCALLVVITALLGILMFPKIGRHQKSRGIVRRITAYVLSLVITAGACLGGLALSKLDKTFDAITQPQTVSTYVGIYVRADDPAGEIADAADYRFAVTDSFDAENSAATVEALTELLGRPADTRSYASVYEMADALLGGDADAIILNEAFLEIFPEVEGYETFASDTRLLYEHCVVTEVTPTTPPAAGPEDPTAETEDPLTAPFLAYLSGSDTRSHLLSQSRSDVNILAVVNPETHQILLVNTPRDYFVPNPAYGGALDKLTHCGLNGTENSAKALGNLYGQTVDYTAQINFTGFETLIDSIGGINIYSENGDGVLLSAGNNYMNGEQALHFARDRYDYASGDNARGEHQMMVIKAVVDKMISGSIIMNYSEILDSLQGMFVTSMPSERISELIKLQIRDMSGWNVLSYAVTGVGGSDRPAAMGGLYAYVMYPNQETVDHAADLISRVLNDEILTEQDVQPLS